MCLLYGGCRVFWFKATMSHTLLGSLFRHVFQVLSTYFTQQDIVGAEEDEESMGRWGNTKPNSKTHQRMVTSQNMAFFLGSLLYGGPCCLGYVPQTRDSNLENCPYHMDHITTTLFQGTSHSGTAHPPLVSRERRTFSCTGIFLYIVLVA